MVQKLIDNFLKFGNLSEKEKNAIIESMDIIDLKKGDFLLKEGQKLNNSYFVLSGCIRQYNLHNGDEKTTRFFIECDWVISAEGGEPNDLSLHNWVCMEDSVVVAGNEKKAQELFNSFPQLETISRKIVEQEFSTIQKNMVFYHSATPEQRYLDLYNNKQSILQRVPQYQIASYIGVKPESLSRIRKRIAQKDLL